MTTNADSVQEQPLTPAEIKSRLDKDGMVSGLVLIDVSDLIDREPESVLDLLSERLVGSCLGMEIDYKAVRVQDGSIVMRVTVDPSMVLDAADEDDDPAQIDSSEKA